jgi:plasmid maintenance system antidote protein VapI
MKIKPIHPVEFLIEEFNWNKYKAQLLIGDRVTKENIDRIVKETGWHAHMWRGIQAKYDEDLMEEERWES